MALFFAAHRRWESWLPRPRGLGASRGKPQTEALFRLAGSRSKLGEALAGMESAADRGVIAEYGKLIEA